MAVSGNRLYQRVTELPSADLPLSGDELLMIVQYGQSKQTPVSSVNTFGGTVNYVGLTQPASGLEVSGSPITNSGTMELFLRDDLLALEDLTGSGIAVRTGTNTWALRQISGTAGRVSVSDIRTGDAIIDLIASGVTAGTYGSADTIAQIVFDAYGRATNVTNVPVAISVSAVTGAVPSSRQITGSGSIIGGGDLSADRQFTLSGDVAAPSVSSYYGTDGSGAKGYHTLPVPRAYVDYVGLQQPASGLTVSGSPITGSGTMVLTLVDDLAAVEGLSTTGLAVRTGVNAWTTRTLSSEAGISITNPGGVAGDPILALTSDVVRYSQSGNFQGGIGGAVRDFGSVSGVVQLDFSGNNNFRVTAIGPLTFTGTLNVVSGRGGIIEILQASSGLASPTWAAEFMFGSDTAPVISTTSGNRDFLAYYVASDSPVRIPIAVGVGNSTS